MTRDDLIDALAERAGVPRHSAQVFLHACFDVTKSLLRGGEQVSLPGLGSWTPQRAPDGSLVAVLYAAFVPVTPLTAIPQETYPLHEAAALADARHFIPAAALHVGSPVERVPVDIAEIVADVRRSVGLIAADKENPSIEFTKAEDASVAASPSLPSPESPADIPAVPVFSPPPDGEADEEEALLEMEMEAEGYQTDPLSDEEVFHRNRDQLYHPPDEPGRRTLLITAGILTFCVLVIIVYLLLDQSEPRELPGSAPVGALVAACEL